MRAIKTSKGIETNEPAGGLLAPVRPGERCPFSPCWSFQASLQFPTGRPMAISLSLCPTSCLVPPRLSLRLGYDGIFKPHLVFVLLSFSECNACIYCSSCLPAASLFVHYTWVEVVRRLRCPPYLSSVSVERSTYLYLHVVREIGDLFQSFMDFKETVCSRPSR